MRFCTEIFYAGETYAKASLFRKGAQGLLYLHQGLQLIEQGLLYPIKGSINYTWVPLFLQGLINLHTSTHALIFLFSSLTNSPL